MDQRRAPLTREGAVAAAIGLADDEGIGALSMRSLATRLGVTPMALYKHVADKGELLDGMVDAVVAGYVEPVTAPTPPGESAPEDGWRAEMRARILAARAELEAHPWLRRLIETRTTRTPHVLAHMDALAGVLISGGLSVDLAHHAMHALGHRIWGFSPEAFSEDDEGPADAAAPAPADPAQQQALMQAMALAYPNIVAIAAESAQRNPTGACDEEFEFEFTLDLLLDAFARLHQAGWSSPRR